MADAKKPDKGKGGGKPAAPSSESSFEQKLVLAGIIAVMVIFIILPAVLTVFGTSTSKIFPADLWQNITSAFESFITTVSYISIFISLVFVCAIVYFKVLFGEVRRKQYESMAPAKPAASSFSGTPGPDQLQGAGPDPRWRDIEGLMQSSNSADWRIAILEADIMLEDMLTQMGYQGESIGDKLKKVDPTHFKTVQEAWRAHKVRNTIAHEGASFQLSRSEADEAIGQFKRVFDEFYFI